VLNHIAVVRGSTWSTNDGAPPGFASDTEPRSAMRSVRLAGGLGTSGEADFGSL
jgi:hypothetical protein